MAKLNLSDIKNGTLVSKIHTAVIEFDTLDDETASVEVCLKQLPFAETEELHKRLAKQDKSVVADWLSKSIVDEEGKPEFTAKQVNELFTQSLVNNLFDKVLGLDKLKKTSTPPQDKKDKA